MEQTILNLYPEPKRHRSCRGCCHLETIWHCPDPKSTREVAEYGCDLSNYGYRPKDSPRYCRGCPDGMPEMWETAQEHNERTEYGSLHPITLQPIRHGWEMPTKAVRTDGNCTRDRGRGR